MDCSHSERMLVGQYLCLDENKDVKQRWTVHVLRDACWMVCEELSNENHRGNSGNYTSWDALKFSLTESEINVSYWAQFKIKLTKGTIQDKTH
ncbi:hypothetical protein Bpfe_009308 [Biomphalaria pfeifferi]|uniref:Uncharacterized protein n=1 Tax=Biomphalaria pfeifferi TaxID=112525 RepID=A0AAD8BW55_BIOPF|nr:hypothetical protein Bpfe_009308 [Biomphalaria pfeifferi]